jgi:hypothetical protein
MPLAFPVRADGRETFLSNETEVFDHDRSPSTEARQPSRRASHDPYEQRAHKLAPVNQLARAQNALLFNVKVLIDQVQSLSGTVQQMASTMNGKAGEDEGRRQLH